MKTEELKRPKTLKDITKLRLTFDFGYMSMVEWFEVHEFGKLGVLIKSGLCHADGETLSPYHFEKYFYGKNYRKNALKDFLSFYDEKIKPDIDFKFGR